MICGRLDYFNGSMYTELADTIRNHPNVRMIEVDVENREILVHEVLTLLSCPDD